MYDGKVSKFGGTSLANADRIAHVGEIISSDENRRLIVVSAFGKESKSDIGVTDQLIGLASSSDDAARTEYLENLRTKLLGIANGLDIGEDIAKEQIADLESRLGEQFSDPKQCSDYVKAWGEYTSALYLTSFLRMKGVHATFIDPRDIFVLSEHPGDAVILPESDQKIKDVLQHIEGVAVIPGYYGYTKKGEIATLPRGGSDTTGGKIAGVLRVSVYENFTDVDHIRRASSVEGALPIKYMTYDEAMELSYMGFGVLKDEAIKPCMDSDVPIHVRNTFNAGKEGTWILRHREPDKYDITGIAFRPGFCSLNIRKVLHSRDNDHTLGAYVLHTEGGVTTFNEFPIEHVATGVSNISFLIPQEYFTTMIVNKLTRHLADYFQIPPTDINPDFQPISLISVVGLGMAEKSGITARVAAAIASQEISIRFITQGASELSIIYGVNETGPEPLNARKAVEAIYKEFYDSPKIGKVLGLVK